MIRFLTIPKNRKSGNGGRRCRGGRRRRDGESRATSDGERRFHPRLGAGVPRIHPALLPLHRHGRGHRLGGGLAMGRRQRGVQHSAGMAGGMGRLSFGHVALIWDGRIIRYGRSERRSRCCSHGGSGASSGGAGAADARRAPVRSVRSKRCGATINGEAPAPRLIAGGCAGVAFCRPATANQYAMDDFGSPHLRATSSGTQTKRQETVTAHKSGPAGTTYGQKRYLCGR